MEKEIVEERVQKRCDVIGFLWIELASEFDTIILDIASVLLKCSPHYLLNSLTAHRHKSPVNTTLTYTNPRSQKELEIAF